MDRDPMESDYKNCLWLESAPAAPDTGTLKGRVAADVAVVGSGYTGCSTALHLAEAGKSVVLVEARDLAYGCSSRNGAGIFPIWGQTTPAAIQSRYGDARGARMTRMTATCGDVVENLIRKHGIDCGYRDSGILITASNGKELALLTERMAPYAEFGQRHEILGREQVQNYLATDRYTGGVVCDALKLLHPTAYARGLAAAAIGAGARIYTHSPAISVERTNGRWRLRCAEGEVDAGALIIATNAYTETLWPGLDRTFYRIPIRMVASTPLTDKGRSILRQGIPFMEMSPKAYFSVSVDPDGRIFSAVMPPLTGAQDVSKVARCYAIKFARIFPEAPALRWQHHWGGYISITPDGAPRVFRLDENVYAALGYNGGGIGQATVMGKELAEMIVTGEEDACSVPVTEMKPVPLAKLVPPLMKYAVFPVGRLAYRFV